MSAMNDASVWIPNSRSTDNSFLAEFCEVVWGMEQSILDARFALASIALGQDPQLLRMSFRRSAEQVSVYLRKLLDDGLLLRSISRPKLHGLRPASGRDGACVSLVRLEEDGSYTSFNEGLQLYSLPGWDFHGFSALRYSTDAFRVEGRASLKWQRWMKQPVLIAGPKGAEERFSLEDILSYVWNAYGAHFDDGNPNRPRSRKGKHWPYLDFVRDSESGLNYPLFLSLAVGCYIRKQAMQSYSHRHDDWVKLCGGNIPPHSPAPLRVTGSCNMEIYAPMNWSKSGADTIAYTKKPLELEDIQAMEAKLPSLLPRSASGGWAMRPAVRK